jgi:hypothetical protein
MSADATTNAQRDTTQRTVPAEGRAICAFVALLVSGWAAAGDLGLLIRPLADAITVAGLAAAVVAAWPPRRMPVFVVLPLGLAVAVFMIGLGVQPLGVLAVALVAALLALLQPQAASDEDSSPQRRASSRSSSTANADRSAPPEALPPSATGRLLMLAAMATAALALFRLAIDGIPTLWLVVDGGSALLGRLAGRLAGSPLEVGPTYAGVDYLVVMAVLYGGWLAWSRTTAISTDSSGNRPAEADLAQPAAWKICQPLVWGLPLVILIGHFVYLVVLARTNTWLEMLPAWVQPQPSDNSRFGVWTWGNALRTMLPWGLPLLAAMIHATIAAMILRMSRWLPSDDPALLTVDNWLTGAAGKRAGTGRPSGNASRGGRNQPRPSDEEQTGEPPLAADIFFRFGPIVLSVIVPLVIVAGGSPSSLAGKRILAYNEGYLNWIRPTYDNLDVEPITAYGLLPWLTGSLGGEFATSDELTERELEAADVCLLIHPDRPWPEERLDRLWKWVEGGGTLLLAAEPTMLTEDSRSRFDEVLAPASIRVRKTTAVTATRNWDENYDRLNHPTTASLGEPITGGGGPGRNWFGYERSATLDVSWPASPLLLGRHAFAEPGSHAMHIDPVGYDAGERLGDLILAAEQSHGDGRVIVLADASPLSNEMLTKSYVFSGRVLAYLAGDGSNPQAGWRQLLGLLTVAGLGVVLLCRPNVGRVILAAIALAAATWTATAVTHYESEVRPTGEALVAARGAATKSPNASQMADARGIAYIDAAHVNPFADDPTVDNGIGLFAETLARNGYLPLLLPSFSEERLDGAEIYVTIAPQRDYSTRQRAVVERWVGAGGLLFVSTGAEQAGPSNQLIEQFGIRIPPSPVSPWSDEREPVP